MESVNDIITKGSLIGVTVSPEMAKSIVRGVNGATGLVECSKDLDRGNEEIKSLLSNFIVEGDE